jgi:hypothetical protein
MPIANIPKQDTVRGAHFSSRTGEHMTIRSTRGLGRLVVISGLLLLFALADSQRWAYGHDDGNYLASAELITLVCIATVALLFSGAPVIQPFFKTPSHSAWILLGTTISAWFLFLGWFVHPDQRFHRASIHEYSIREEVIQLQRQPKVSAEKMEYASRLLRAAELRRAAAEVEPDDSSGAWMLVGIGGILLVLIGGFCWYGKSTPSVVAGDSEEKS